MVRRSLLELRSLRDDLQQACGLLPTGLVAEEEAMEQTMTPRIVGWSGIYQGSDHQSLHGKRVSIIAVRKPMAPPEERLRITSNEELAALGGLETTDRVDVALALGDGTLGEVGADVAVQDLDNAYWIFNPPPPDSHVG